MKLLLRYRVEISSHLDIVFNIKNKLRLRKKINILSWDEISPRLADPSSNFHPGMKYHFSPYHRNFSFIPGLKQKIPLEMKLPK